MDGPEHNSYRCLFGFILCLELEFTTEEIESFFDELQDVQPPFVLCSFGLTHQPSKKHFASVVGCKSWAQDRPLPPDNYKLWLDVFDDAGGYSYYVFYPDKAKKGQPVEVFFNGNLFNFTVNWVHGEPGLFERIIINLLNLEYYQYSNNKKIVDCIQAF